MTGRLLPLVWRVLRHDSTAGHRKGVRVIDVAERLDSHVCGTAITARQLSVAQLRRHDEWDRFAQKCHASYYCARAYILPHQLSHHVSVFEIFAGDQKIGQCALIAPRTNARKRTFLDALQLEPQHQSRWAEVMSVVLRTCGSGQFAYGSVWNLEEPRDDMLAAIRGVGLVRSEGWRVMSIDFADFLDWNHYHRSISTNIKRNVAKAQKSDPEVTTETEAGFPSLANLKRIISLRQDVFERKQVTIQSWRFTLLRRLLMLRRHISVSWVKFHGKYTAYALCLRWGEKVYYTDGASIRDNGGSSWYLMTEIIRAHYRECPKGNFVMGFDPVTPWGEDTKQWDNLMGQRQQCRAGSKLTSVVVFRYEE